MTAPTKLSRTEKLNMPFLEREQITPKFLIPVNCNASTANLSTKQIRARTQARTGAGARTRTHTCTYSTCWYSSAKECLTVADTLLLFTALLPAALLIYLIPFCLQSRLVRSRILMEKIITFKSGLARELLPLQTTHVTIPLVSSAVGP